MVVPLVPGWAFLKFGLANDVIGPIFGGVNRLVMGVANVASPRLVRRFGTVRTIVLTQASFTSVSLLDAFLSELRHGIIDLYRQEYVDDDVESRAKLSPNGPRPTGRT